MGDAALAAAVDRLAADRAPLVAAATARVTAGVPALAALPAGAVDAFVELLLEDAAPAVLDDRQPSEALLRELAPFVEQRAELGVAVDDVLRGLHLGSQVVVDALLAEVDPPLDGPATARVMRRVEEWLDRVRRQVLVVHRRTEIELAQQGRDRSNALLAAVLDPRQALSGHDPGDVPVDLSGPLHLTRSRPAVGQPAWSVERAVVALLPGPALGGVVDGDVVTLGAGPLVRAPDGLRVAVGGPVEAADLPEVHRLLGVALALDDGPGLVDLVAVAERVAQAGAPVLGRLLHRALLPGLDPARREHRDLLATVERYVAEGARLDATATGLHVHPNTVKHRLARWRRLTGTDPAAPAGRAELLWAVRVALYSERG